MRKFLPLAVLICVILSLFPFDAHALFKSTKVILVVADEDGTPLDGVDAGVAFERNTGWGTDVTPQDKFTDGEGKATFSGQSNGHIAYGAEKEGYYPSYYDYDFKDLGPFGWKPWNPELKIVMRKIGNPVPMYARNARFSNLSIPVIGKDLGFDLIEFDWVQPYGAGKNADFIFHLEKKFSGMRDYESKLTLTFSNENDGIIEIEENFENGSEYKLLREAPVFGYQNSMTIIRSRKPNGSTVKNYQDDDNYIFRVRSIKNEDGDVRAMYGKIHGPIVVEPRTEPADLNFKYYLNPDYTRNLEFDPNRNLFDNLPPLERVGIK